jgi:osmotically inducible protein OsmC
VGFTTPAWLVRFQEGEMIVRQSEAEWKGDVKEGTGTIKVGSGAFSGPYGFKSRFESGPGTNPEELIGAAHAGCFSMALSAGLGKAGYKPERVHTTAKVHLEKVGDGFSITIIDLETVATVPGMEPEKFQAEAETAKKNCPVSKVLAGAKINLKARLV